MKIKFRGKDINGNYEYGLLTKKKIRSSGELRFAIATGNCSMAETVPVVEPEVLIGDESGYAAVTGAVKFRAEDFYTREKIEGGYFESEGNGYIVQNFQFTLIDKATLERAVDWEEVEYVD